MDVVLNINKPSGVTSHDVVMSARKILHEKRIGHTGTLDPLATGVLVLCVGKATRIARYLEAGEKEYKAVMRLGVTTDTLDSDGQVLETKTYTPPDRQKILDVIQGFTGSIMQCPPAYSAVKVAGVPSYKLAREGKAKPLMPRSVQIFRIELTAYEDPLVRLAVHCSKGVYIRTLCAEIGDSLGMGAHLEGLERTRSGSFSIDHAVTLEQLKTSIDSGDEAQFTTSISDALAHLPSVLISESETVRVLHGNQIDCPASCDITTSDLFRIYGQTGMLLALARSKDRVLRPELVFS